MAAAVEGEEALPAQVEPAGAAADLELRFYHLGDQGIKELGRLQLCGPLPPAALQGGPEATVDGGEAEESQVRPGFYLAVVEGGEIKDLAHLSSLVGHRGASTEGLQAEEEEVQAEEEELQVEEGKAPDMVETSVENETSVGKGKDGSGEEWEESSEEEEEGQGVDISEEEDEDEEEGLERSEEEDEDELYLQVRIWPGSSVATLALFSAGCWNFTREYTVHWLKDDQKDALLVLINIEGNQKEVPEIITETENDASQPSGILFTLQTPYHWSKDCTSRLEFAGHLLYSDYLEGTIKFDLKPSMDHFEVGKRLGKGSTCRVYKCASTGTSNNAHYALKMIPVEKYDDKFYNYENKEPREINILSCLKDNNVVKFYQAWTTNECSYLEEDTSSSEEAWSANERSYLDGGRSSNLEAWTANESSCYRNSDSQGSMMQFENVESDSSELKPVPKYICILMESCISTLEDILIIGKREIHMEQSWTLFENISEAVKCIHQNGVIHRDLKPANIFIGPDGGIKIGDFGHACWVQSHIDGQKGGYGTGVYAAPELDKGPVTEKVDIYSLGFIFCEIFHPFGTGMERGDILNGLKESKCPKDWVGDYVFLKKLTASCPSDRPSASDILEYIAKRQ